MFYPFFDTAVTSRYANAKVGIGPVRKENRVLMAEGYFQTPQVRWEQRIDNGYPNVFYDEEAGIYRLYYTCIVEDPNSVRLTPAQRVGERYRIGRAEEGLPRIAAVLYAYSKDGVNWVRPALGNVEFEGSRDNNILLYDAHGASVFKDPHDPDPARRYKMMVRHDAKNQMAVSFSADGEHFCEPIAWPEYNPAGDTHNFAYFDERIGRYVLITRTWDSLRLVARSESDDFIHWTKPENIYRGIGLEDQIYSMPIFRYEGLYVGLPSIFHDGDRDADSFDCVDCELSMSHDTIGWERVAKGESFIPRANGRYGSGVPDCGCIYASVPVAQGDDLVFYYLGGSGQHTNFRESSLMRAFVDRRRLAGYVPKKNVPARLNTHLLRLSGEEVRLSADVSPYGEVRYALCRPARGFYGECEPLEGFGFEDCVPMRQSGDAPIAFAGGALSQLAGEDLVLALRFERAQVFGVEGSVELKAHR